MKYEDKVRRRERNRIHAKLSRVRKKQKIVDLESQILALMFEQMRLRAIILTTFDPLFELDAAKSLLYSQ
tara:strand:- start:304 stop:513 length:210 start_codon:yes stop_codon:yes gene_type:complete